MACGLYFPDQGPNSGPLQWDHGVLATGQPGKSPSEPILRAEEGGAG